MVFLYGVNFSILVFFIYGLFVFFFFQITAGNLETNLQLAFAQTLYATHGPAAPAA